MKRFPPRRRELGCQRSNKNRRLKVSRLGLGRGLVGVLSVTTKTFRRNVGYLRSWKIVQPLDQKLSPGHVKERGNQFTSEDNTPLLRRESRRGSAAYVSLIDGESVYVRHVRRGRQKATYLQKTNISKFIFKYVIIPRQEFAKDS